MFTRKGFISLYVAAWLIKDIEVEAYMYLSGCSGGYCFTISDISHANEYLDQSNAQQRCQSNGNQLAEIRNEDIQNSLVNFIRNSQGLNSWNVLTNGKRSSGIGWIRLSGNEASGGLAVYDQTDQSYAYGYLKSTTSGLDLYASRPTKIKEGFICSGVTDCSGGVPINGQCYKSFTETLSWYDARNRCLDAGGDLASFDHITTNDGFNALNGSWINTSNSYWIGFRREWWTWQTTNSDVKYSDWLTGHPINDYGRANSDCLCLSTTDWKWIECGCNQPLPFVCISVTPSTTTTRTTAFTASAIKTSSEATLTVASKSNEVSTPTISSTTTSYSTGNDTGSIGQPMGLTCNAVGVTVGLTVGLCIGIPLIIVIVALAVVITRLKKQLSEAHLSPKANQKTSSKNRIQQPIAGDVGELSVMTEGPYESMQPRIEGMTDGCYQSLDLSKKTDNAIISSNT